MTDYFIKANLGSGDIQSLMSFDGSTYRIGSDTSEVAERIKLVLANDEQLQGGLRLLFAKPGSHIRIKKEYHIGKGLVTRVEYIGFPPTVIDTPEELKPF